MRSEERSENTNKIAVLLFLLFTMAAALLKDAARTEQREVDSEIVWRNVNFRKELSNHWMRMNRAVHLQIVILKLLPKNDFRRQKTNENTHSTNLL
jgi:hypothetical protein